MKIEGLLSKGTWVNVVGLLISVLFSIIVQVRSQRSTRWKEGSLRLIGGSGEHEGTVLIYHWSRWGAICDTLWGEEEANVVCRELGFAGARQAVRRSKFGKGRRRVWLSGLQCRGNERHLTMCNSFGWGNHRSRCRGYWSSAGVVCNRRKITTTTTTTTTTEPTTTTTKKPTTTTSTTKPTTTTTRRTTKKPTTAETTTTTTTKKPTTVARPPPVYNKWIYDRESYRYFMYFRDGSFITSAPDPRYVSRNTTTTTTTTPRPTRRPTRRPSNRISNEIDNNIPQEIRHRHENTQRRHNSHRNSVKEGYQQDQPMVDVGDLDNSISNDLDISDETSDETSESVTTDTDESEEESQSAGPTPPTYTDYRVKGGRDYKGFKEGRLEIRLANSFTWGVICGDNWDQRAAIVACRHFNAGYARQPQTTDYYGGSDMDKVVARMRCTGKEERLEDCQIETYENTPGKIACSRRRSVAGIICETRLPDLEPELRAIEESVFLNDKYLYYLQCAHEEKCLSSSADALHGTRSWAYASRRLLRFSTIAKNIGTADFRPNIDRSQWEWHACHMHYHSMEAFSHYDIIDSHGNQVAEGHKASFCLEDSKCERGAYPKYNCQGFGHQGISVGCSDSYLADIDCQWIDVTDVTPGTYTLKIELNPNMKVPEISYDNNVAVCDLYFNTRYARVSNCKLDSLL